MKFEFGLTVLAFTSLCDAWIPSTLHRRHTGALVPQKYSLERTNLAVSASTLPPPPSIQVADEFPQLGEDGIWHIQNKVQHRNFLEANKNRLVVLKVFAPWCRACKGAYVDDGTRPRLRRRSHSFRNGHNRVGTKVHQNCSGAR